MGKEITVKTVGNNLLSKLFEVNPRKFNSIGGLVRAMLEGEDEKLTLAIVNNGGTMDLVSLSIPDESETEDMASCEVYTGTKVGTKNHNWKKDGVDQPTLENTTINDLLDGDHPDNGIYPENGEVVIVDQVSSKIFRLSIADYNDPASGTFNKESIVIFDTELGLDPFV